MKPLLALAAAPLVVSATPLEHGPIYAGMPPDRYWMTDAAVVTLYVNDVEAYCGTRAPPGYNLMGCTLHVEGGTVIVLLNPCAFNGEVYARIACHERAHSLGWGGSHEL